jgi:tRNA dimethylallyltransferase
MAADPPTDARPLAIALMGPTASGKTALALEWAARLGSEVISVDSALVYRGLDIGTAKPDAATLARFPHRLIDIRDPGQPYSAAQFRKDALAAMREIGARGRVPLLVGGTGLYFRALELGLSSLPEADPSTRERLAGEALAAGWASLHARLARIDPEAAARIRPGDAQRIQRALEVIELSGRPLSKQQGGLRSRLPWRVLKLCLYPVDRAVLHARIARRFDAMLAAGFLDEVRRLRDRYPAGIVDRDLPAWRTVGYRQALEHLDQGFDAAELRDRVVFATRQLAKRQITWLRSELDARRFDPERSDLVARAREALGLFLARH